MDDLHLVHRRAGRAAEPVEEALAALDCAADGARGLAIGLATLRHWQPGEFLPLRTSRGFRNSDSQYHLAADGISLTLVLLTGIVAMAGILFSWNIEKRTQEFFAFYLVLIGGVYGVFFSFDLFLLFVFYEIAIIPKYFLIAIWGSVPHDATGENAGSQREYAAMKLALYSFAGSALVLAGMVAAWVASGGHSMSFDALTGAHFSTHFQMGRSRWCLWGSRCWRACGRSTPGRPPATRPRRQRLRCCWRAW